MNLLQMDMNLLKVLYVLLETSSTGKTAQKLALSPSAVSHALMRLRDALTIRCSTGGPPDCYALCAGAA